MEPELAVALPAAGAVFVGAMQPRPRLALALGAVLGLGGVAAALLSRPGLASDQLGVAVSMSGAGRSMLMVAAGALACVVILIPQVGERAAMLQWGLGGIAGMAALAVAPSLQVSVLIVLGLAVMQATGASSRSFTSRLRAPVLGAALLGLGVVFAELQGPAVLGRLGAVGLGTGLAAALGAIPYLHGFDQDEPVFTSPIPWIAFVGPALAVAVVEQSRSVIGAAAGAFSALLIGLGLLNMAWGSVASWRSSSDAAAWRYSFMADWGLALCGFGLLLPSASAGALLVLYTITLSRLPIYLWSRDRKGEAQADRPINLIVAAALAGSAPFAGFSARILLLQAATSINWPLALVLTAGMLLWLPGSLRLGRTLASPTRRQQVGIGVTLAASVALGLFPRSLLSLAGL